MKRVFIAFALICAMIFVHVLNVGAVCKLVDKKTSTTDYTVTLENNNIITNSISAQNLDSLYSTLSANNMSEYEKNVYVLKELGFSDEIIESMSQDDVNNMLENAESIQVEVKYLVTDSEGETTIISEDECMALIDQYNSESSLSVLDNGGFSANLVGGGCMRITISSIYIDPSSNNNVKGWFDIHAWYEWLILDNQRHTDAISISADNFVWSDRKQSDYSSSYYYKVRDLNGNESTYSERADGNAGEYSSCGMGYTWKVPKDSGSSLVVTYIQYYLRGKGHVRDATRNDSFNVNARYEHVVENVSIDVQITYQWSNSMNDGDDLMFIYTIIPTLNIDTVGWISKNDTTYSP